jgi:hypothetical protein
MDLLLPCCCPGVALNLQQVKLFTIHYHGYTLLPWIPGCQKYQYTIELEDLPLKKERWLPLTIV